MAASIGTSTKGDNGFSGQIKTVRLNVKAKFAPAEKENDKAPDCRIFAGQTVMRREMLRGVSSFGPSISARLA